MTDKLRVVGKRLPLSEAYEKATGRAEYCCTMHLPGMLVGKVLRSPHAHARVVSVDTTKAELLPGVVAVVTAADVPRNLFTYNVMTYQSQDGEVADVRLFDEKVRYVGDPVAAVAAVDEAVAREALALIHVEYETLPAVFNVDDAVQADAPKIHDFAENNIGVPATPFFGYGDVDKGFAESDIIKEAWYSTSKQVQAGLENACSVADYKAGRLTVWSQTQLPHMCRRMLAHIFDLRESQVRLIQPYAGTGFGAGCDMNGEPIAAALAMKAGVPVKVWFDRTEDFRNRFTREHVAKIYMKMGILADGTPKALKASYIGDAGAYMGKTMSGAFVALASNITAYEFESMDQDLQAIYTNHVGCGAMRGFGGMQSSFARETLVDELCDAAGLDPLEFRLKHHRTVGGLGWFPGTAISSCGLDECLRVGAESIGWAEKRGQASIQAGRKKRGVGTACMGWLSGAQPMLLEHTNATIKLNSDGSATLIVSPGRMGQGLEGTLAQIAAEVLGIRYEDVHLFAGDTDITGFDIGTHASRGLYCIGRAVMAAAQQVKTQVLARAATKLEVSAGDLDILDGRICSKNGNSVDVDFTEFATSMVYTFGRDAEQIVAHATVEPTDFAPPWQAGFAEVEVDTDTGVVSVVKWVTVHDIGRAINPAVVEGQLEGAAVQGFGFALCEDPVISPKNGIMESDGFDKYRIMSTVDIPDYECLLVEPGDPTGPFGAKSVGESGLFLQAPAIANAIYDAVGIRLRDLPMTPERVLAALKEKEAAGGQPHPRNASLQ